MDKKRKQKSAASSTSTVQPVPVVVPVKAPETDSSKIWNEIKDKQISMFALPGQRVSDYCKQVTVEPSKLYLLSTASSVLPALESAIGGNYVVEVVDKYIVVSRSVQFPFKK